MAQGAREKVPCELERSSWDGGNDQHVVRNGNQWQVKGEGNARATKNLATQKEAIEYAREIAKNQRSEVVIHRPDGSIRDSDSYGKDLIFPRSEALDPEGSAGVARRFRAVLRLRVA